jgi:hypothetical protein
MGDMPTMRIIGHSGPGHPVPAGKKPALERKSICLRAFAAALGNFGGLGQKFGPMVQNVGLATISGLAWK